MRNYFLKKSLIGIAVLAIVGLIAGLYFFSKQFVQCTQGICCNISTKKFRAPTYKCKSNVKVEYGCPWGNTSGSDVGIRYLNQFCSGTSPLCNGVLKWSDWEVYRDCSSTQACSNGKCKTIDTTPPFLSITINDGAEIAYNKTVSLILTCTDESGVKDVRYTDNAKSTPYESFTPTKTWTLSSGDGRKIVTYECRDVYGNTATATDDIWLRTRFLVKPYLVYPVDKSMYPQYETAVKNYLVELQNWYLEKVGKTFTIPPLKVVRSSYDYLTMRCGENPTQACINDPSKLEGNWGAFMNKAIHEGSEEWEEETVAFIFSAGGGGYAGGNQYPNYTGFAITGDWVLEPLSNVPNEWGIPCSYSDGWQCEGGTPKGTPAHELGHAFGLPHPGEEYAGQSIMQSHWEYPTAGFIPREIDFLRNSPFFKSK